LTIFFFWWFKACDVLGTLEDGKCVYHRIIQNGLEMNVLWQITWLVSMQNVGAFRMSVQ
jgi:hypothetical protein